MNANKSMQPEVSSGLYAAIRAKNQEAVQKFFKGESDDPAQIIERLEERAESEEE